MVTLSGLIVSRGITCGKAFLYKRGQIKINKRKLREDLECDREINRFKTAVSKSRKELEVIKNNFLKNGNKDLAHIFRSQLTMTEDEEFLSEVERKIVDDKVNAEWALEFIIKEYEKLFNQLEETDYNKERLNDLRDVGNRIMKNLLQNVPASLKNLPENSIIVATEIFPSDTAEMDRGNISGIITERGGVTSHVSIIAKSLNIPAVIGVSKATDIINNKESICIDALSFENGTIYVNPEDKIKKEIEKKKFHYNKYKKELDHIIKFDPITSDGNRIVVSANIGSIDDYNKVKEKGIKSIGLFRTEFLFLESEELPDEDEQFEIYKKVAEGMKPGMVVIRTLDVGGDKPLPSIKIPPEQNPFLGLRAIRVGLKYPEILKPQIAAILRASWYGNIKMMFPMVSDLNEIRRLKNLVSDVKKYLSNNGIPYNNDIKIGIMIEIPSAAIMADVLSKEIDFFSIGTNDLTQYLLAADRMNENVSEFYKPFHPSVFRMIKNVVNAVKNTDKWVGVCGELGGMINAIPILIGLGVTELSMDLSLIPSAINVIRNISLSECIKIAKNVLKMETDEEVKSYISNRMKNVKKNLFMFSKYENKL